MSKNTFDKTLSIHTDVSDEGSELKPKGIEAKWEMLDGQRSYLLDKVADQAAVTIPSLFPPDWKTESQSLPTPYQSIGARAVNNLANKLLLTLFPVSSPFFKLEVPQGLVYKAEADANGKKLQDILEEKLSILENIIQSDIETSAFRPKLYEAMRQLIVVGDFLLHIPKDGSPEGFRVDKYVVRRSFSGQPLEIIVKEKISRAELDSEWLEALEAEDKARDAKTFNLFTRVYLEDDKYHEIKTIHGVELPGTAAIYPKDASAWLPLRWSAQSGDDYGTSYVEEYMGGMLSLEGLAKAIQEYAGIASRTFGVLRPNSTLTPRDLATVPNGGFVVGDPEDIMYPSINKSSDLEIARQTFQSTADEIARAFLVTQIRDSERTTAAEIRLQAQELETSLGGAYSLFSVTLQQPLLLREIERLKSAGQLPKFNKADLSPKVIVGLEGLGRGTDLEKLMKAAEAIAQLEVASRTIPKLSMDKIFDLVFSSVGLDSSRVMKTDEEEAAEQAAARQQQMTQQMTQTMTDGIAKSLPGVTQELTKADPEMMRQTMGNMTSGMTQPPQ